MKPDVGTCSINEINEWGLLKIMGASLHPNEAELLAFYERNLSMWNRARMERHLAECDACRESIAMMVTLDRETTRDSAEKAAQVGEDTVRSQLDKIVAIMKDDEARYASHAQRKRSGTALPALRMLADIPIPRSLMLAAASLIFILLAIPVLWIATQPSPSKEAMQALQQAVTKERRTTAVMSGLPYSEYRSLRGDARGDDLMFERAASKVKNTQTSLKNRLALARVWLARNSGDDAQRALEVFDGAISSGQANAADWNDKGVAEIELSKYEEATASFSAALQLSPALPEALFNRAVSEETSQRYNEARLDLEKFMNTNPDAVWRAEAERMMSRLGKPGTSR